MKISVQFSIVLDRLLNIIFKPRLEVHGDDALFHTAPDPPAGEHGINAHAANEDEKIPVIDKRGTERDIDQAGGSPDAGEQSNGVKRDSSPDYVQSLVVKIRHH